MLQTNITARKKDNGWQCIVSYKQDSKWKQSSKQGFKTKKEAQAWGKLREQDLQNISGEFSKDYSKITFEEYKNIFLQHIKLHYTNGTFISYKTSFASFNSISDKRMIDIKPQDIQDITDNLIRNGIKIATIKRYLLNSNKLFNHYKSKSNPMFESPVKEIMLGKDKSSGERLIPTDEQYKELLEKTKRNRNTYIIILLAGSCGLRFSEIIGLTWDRIGDDYIKIDRQWGIKKGVQTFTEPKSKNSNRKVPLPPKIKNELDLLKNDTQRIVNVSPSYRSNVIKLIRPFNIHCLRHYYTTKLIANGIDFKTAAAILGHDVSMTMKIYSHVTSQMYNNASKKIYSIFDVLFDE